MNKISFKDYAKKLTEEEDSELFSLELYSLIYNTLKHEDDDELISRSAKLLDDANSINYVL